MRGLRIGVTGARKAHQFAEALARRGAVPVVGPLVTTDLPVDDRDLLEATEQVVSARPDWLAASTGVGMRLWAEVAHRHGRYDVLRDALSNARSVARGAKAVGGLAAFGLSAVHVTIDETDAAVEGWLQTAVTPGQTVAAQLHGNDARGLKTLAALGVRVLSVRPYVAGRLPDDEERARDLVRAVADGSIDLVIFTSPAAVHNLFVLAGQLGDDVARGVERMLGEVVSVAVIGEVTGAACTEHDVPIAVIPERHRQGELVRAIDAWAAMRT